MTDLCKSNWCDKLLTVFPQHLQCFHHQNITLNLSYIVLIHSSRDRVQIGVLGSQLGERQTLLSAYDDATSESIGYLVIDFTSRCNKLLKYRTHLFRGDTVLTYA